jgi:hypothetical protein
MSVNSQALIALLFSEEEATYGGRIGQHLTQAYGPDALCKPESLADTWAQMPIVLLILGSDWEQSPWVDPTQKESGYLAQALAQPQITTYLVLVNDAPLPSSPALSLLSDRAIRLSDYSFNYDLRQLMARLEQFESIQAALCQNLCTRLGFSAADLPLNRQKQLSKSQWMDKLFEFGINILLIFFTLLIPALTCVLLFLAYQAPVFLVLGGVLLILIFSTLVLLGGSDAYRFTCSSIVGRLMETSEFSHHLTVISGKQQLNLHLPGQINLSPQERRNLSYRSYRFYYQKMLFTPRLINLEPLFAGPSIPPKPNIPWLGQGRICIVSGPGGGQMEPLLRSLGARLEATYGQGEVTYVQTLAQVEQSLGQAALVLLGIDSQWRHSADYDSPQDVLLQAYDTASERKLPIIPLLFDGAPMPSQGQGSGRLQALGRINALQIHAYNAEFSFQRVLRQAQQIAALRESSLRFLSQALNFSLEDLAHHRQGGPPPDHQTRHIRRQIFNIHVVRGGGGLCFLLAMALLSQQAFLIGLAAILLIISLIIAILPSCFEIWGNFSEVKTTEGELYFAPYPYLWLAPWTLGSYESMSLMVQGERLWTYKVKLSPGLAEALSGYRVRVYYTQNTEKFFLSLEPL